MNERFVDSRRLSITEQDRIIEAANAVESLSDPGQRRLVVSTLQRQLGERFKPKTFALDTAHIFSIVDSALLCDALPLLVKVTKMIGGATPGWRNFSDLAKELTRQSILSEGESSTILTQLKQLAANQRTPVLASALLSGGAKLPQDLVAAFHQLEAVAGTPETDLQLLVFLELAAHQLTDKPRLDLHRVIDGIASRRSLGRQVTEICRDLFLGATPAVTGRPTAVVPAARKTAARPGTSRLPYRERSNAILIGVPLLDDPRLPSHQAIDNNIKDLTAVLTNSLYGGFDLERIHTFTLQDIDRDMSHMVRLARETTDALVVYYAGHGYTDPNNGALYLARPQTLADMWTYTSLSYNKLRRLVRESTAGNTVVFLDCCFSGAAIVDALSGADAPTPMLDIAGTYVMTATSATQLAHVPKGARNSAFTGALLEVMRTGLNTTDELIPIGKMFEPVKTKLVAKELPAPQQRGTNNVGELALVKNPAYI